MRDSISPSFCKWVIWRRTAIEVMLSKSQSSPTVNSPCLFKYRRRASWVFSGASPKGCDNITYYLLLICVFFSIVNQVLLLKSLGVFLGKDPDFAKYDLTYPLNRLLPNGALSYIQIHYKKSGGLKPIFDTILSIKCSRSKVGSI
ncbi:MAG: hypothetical protein BWY75_03223 [bacterium ADurb.Bin425]|nr:MAG: hypothetical protein BWY75_03223 [bacterium ADurb.Bin425]